MMKRYLLIVLAFTAFSFPVFAQSVDQGYRLYQAGEYDQAKLIFVKYRSSSDKCNTLYENCIELSTLYSIAKDSCFDNQKYQSAKFYCNQILKVNPDCVKSKKLIISCDSALDQLRVQRDNELEYARKSCSEILLEQFRQKYAKQEDQVAKANKISEDLQLWSQAKSAATRESYSDYIRKTKHGYYSSEAEWEIGLIDCEAEWNRIKGNRFVTEFRDFKTVYGRYNRHIDEADAMLKLIDANTEYKAHSLIKAYEIYNDVKSTNLVRFNASEEANYQHSRYFYYYYYTKNTVNDLEHYIANYPDSPFRKDAEKRLVELRKKHRRQERNAAISSDGRFLSLGLSVGRDMKMDKDTICYYNGVLGKFQVDTVSYSAWRLDMRLRLGRSTKPLQLLTGFSFQPGKFTRIAVPAMIHWNLVPEALYFGVGYEWQYLLTPQPFRSNTTSMFVLESALYDRGWELGTRVSMGRNDGHFLSTIGIFFTYYIAESK